MCLDIKSGPHVAEKDILAWKVIYHTNASYWQYFDYTPNTAYKKIALKIRNNIISAYIFAGYHAFRSRKAARLNLHYMNLHYGSDRRTKIVKFIIPKGAKYFIGFDNDIVSNLIVSGDLKPQ